MKKGDLMSMEEDQTLLAVCMIASELEYVVKLEQLANGGVKSVLVLERECEYFHSFVGVNKFALALEWLRRKV